MKIKPILPYILALISHYSYAKKPVPVDEMSLEEKELLKYAHIKTAGQACRLFENKIIAYYDQIAKIENCRRHSIDANEARVNTKSGITEVPASVFYLIPSGKDQKKTASKKIDCKDIEKHYVTSTGDDFYYVENCRLRALEDYHHMDVHNKTALSTIALSEESLKQFPKGKPLKNLKSPEEQIVYQMDGSYQWGLTARQPGNRLRQDSPSTLKDAQNRGRSKPQCQKLNNRVVSFYSQIFFMEKCRRRPLDDLPIDLQQKIEFKGGIQELTTKEYQDTAEGLPITWKKVMKKL